MDLELPPRPTSLAEFLKTRRALRGLTQAELAAKIDVTPDYIAKLESGRRKNPHPRLLQHLSAALGLSFVDRIFLYRLCNIQADTSSDIPAANHLIDILTHINSIRIPIEDKIALAKEIQDYYSKIQKHVENELAALKSRIIGSMPQSKESGEERQHESNE